VCDTSSTIYEFASLDRPVIVLNSPLYRKDIKHGLRFWDNIPGIMIDNPWELPSAIDEAVNKDTYSNVRKYITSIVYPNIGHSSKAAADSIVSFIECAPVGKDNGRG
jgi:CDP-glycerol glycerophosphotransferase (TagB/SpsB family)